MTRGTNNKKSACRFTVASALVTWERLQTQPLRRAQHRELCVISKVEARAIAVHTGRLRTVINESPCTVQANVGSSTPIWLVDPPADSSASPPLGQWDSYSSFLQRRADARARAGPGRGAYCCFANNPTCLRAAPVALQWETARGNRTPTAGTRVPSHSFRPERFLSEVEDTGGRVSAQATLWNVCARPRASVAVIVPLISSTAIESRNAVTAGPRTRGQSAGG